MEKEYTQTKPKEQKSKKTHILKLTYKEKIALEELPLEIEKLELTMEEKNNCLADPACYEKVGISQLADELAHLEQEYERKVEMLLTIQEKEEEIALSNS